MSTPVEEKPNPILRCFDETWRVFTNAIRSGYFEIGSPAFRDQILRNSINTIEYFDCLIDQEQKTRAITLHGYMSQHGIGIENSTNEAYALYKKAANLGEPYAQNLVGWCYRHGYGTPKDNKVAFEWCLKAAEAGNPAGQYFVGQHYQFGRGVEANSYLAYRWYKESAVNGFLRGEFVLAICYKDGCGTAKDIHEAIRWFNISGKNGLGGARNRLQKLFQA